MLNGGALAEERAAQWVIEAGGQVLCRNYSWRGGEIDIVAWHAPNLLFIEVRLRSNTRFVSAAASVDRRKQQKIIRTAQHFLLAHPAWQAVPSRFDVIAFEPRQLAAPAAANGHWIRAAFTQ